MPAYSFQERFIPFVKDGSKPHTIRKRRAKGWAKAGDPLYLFYGLRTSHCVKLRDEVCEKVNTIIISANKSIIIFKDRLTDEQCADVIKPHLHSHDIKFTNRGRKLSNKEKEALAWHDGFRPDGTTAENPEGAFELMFRFWTLTHELPFIGDIIYWIPEQKNIITHAYEPISKRLLKKK